MLHLGQMFESVCLFLLPGTQQQLVIWPSSTRGSEEQLSSIPANQETKGEAPHASPARQAIYRLLDFKP